MEVPHIRDDLIEWSIPLDTKFKPGDHYKIASQLLRCRDISLGHVQTQSHHSTSDDDDNDNDDDNEDSQANSTSQGQNSALHLVGNMVSSSWTKLCQLLPTWIYPPTALINYVRLKETGCPWQVGYLSTPDIQGYAICLIAIHCMELTILPPSLQTRIQAVHKNNHKIQDLSLLELSQCSRDISGLHESKDSHVFSHIKPHLNRSLKWNLTYIDPWPRWRLVSFLNTSESGQTRKPYKSNQFDSTTPDTALSYLVAIGYSNGSVEIIDLSINEDEKPEPGSTTIRRSRILIPSPYLNPILSIEDPDKVLFPIVSLNFLDDCHLLVCHFRGHLDLWHLDWTAKRYPTRLMTRLYPTHRRFNKKQSDCWLNNSFKSIPLLSASFDTCSNLLILSNLPDFRTPMCTSSLHEKLELSCYYLSKSSPFLTAASPLVYLPPSFLNLNLSKLVKFGKYVMVDLVLVNLLRRQHLKSQTASKDSADAIAYVTVCTIQNPSGKQETTLIACLHCCGSYSIWLAPSLEPLTIMANRQEPSADSSTTNSPFRLSWWSKPVDSKGNQPKIEYSSPQLHLSVLCENGLIDLLDIHQTDQQFHTSQALQLTDLNLAPFSHFASLSNQLSDWFNGPKDHPIRTTETVIIQSRLKEIGKLQSVTLSPNLQSANQQQQQQYLVRCTRLKFTTRLSLFNHYIYSGRFDEALRLTKTEDFDVELVHQQRWLKLSCDPVQLKQFGQLIDSTLGKIKHRPLWVIKQCLEFNPSYSATNQINYVQVLDAYRCLTQHGLDVFDRFLRTKEHMTDLHESIRQRLENQLVHIDCLDKLIQNELACKAGPTQLVFLCPDSNKPSIETLLQCLHNFRHFSLLDIAVDLARSRCFLTLNLLMSLFPKSIGKFRLAITSSLSETISPDNYVDLLLKPLGMPSMESAQYKPQLEPDSNLLNMLKSNLSNNFITDDLIQKDLNLYLKILCPWLIQRARQIESRSGLTNYALDLLRQGIQLCDFLIRDEVAQSVNKDTRVELGRLRKAYSEFLQVSQIVYHKHTNPNSSFRILLSSNTSKHVTKVEDMTLARFKSTDYRRMSPSVVVDLLLQIYYPKSSNSVATHQTPNHLSLFILGVILPCIIDKCNDKNQSDLQSDLLAHCLGHLGALYGFVSHNQLLDMVQRPSSCIAFIKSNQKDHRLAHYLVKEDKEIERDLNVLSVDLLIQSLLKVLLDTDSVMLPDPDSYFKSSSLSTAFLSESKSLVTAMLRCSNTSSMSRDLQLVSSCIQALEDFKPLIKSIEQQLGSTVPTKFLSINALYRCSGSGSHLQELLNHWVGLLNRLIVVLRREAKVKVEQQESVDISTLILPKLNSIIPKLYKILFKTFEGYPSQTWLHTGLQYALFVSGDEDLLDLSGKLYVSQSNSGHLDFLKPSNLTPSIQLMWGCCLLQATRTYVDTSIPVRSNLKSFLKQNHRPEDVTDHNERLANRCITIANSLFTKSNFHQLLAAFDVEKHILNASCFLATIRPIASMTQEQQMPPSLPYKIRKLWTLSSQHVDYRQTLLVDLFANLIKSTHSESANVLEILLGDQCLNWIASHFRLSSNQIKRCFLRAYLQISQSNQSARLLGLSHLCRQFLDSLISSVDKAAWLETASWTGYVVIPKQTSSFESVEPQSSPVGSLVPWTSLHLLFNLTKPSSRPPEDSKNSLTELDADLFLLWMVERYRLRLARFSLAYCPKEHLTNLGQIVALCSARLECLAVSLRDQKSSGFGLRSFFKQLTSSTWGSQDAEESEVIVKFVRPGFYAPDSDVLPTDHQQPDEITDQLLPQEQIEYNLEERQLWLCFLLNWAKSQHLNRLSFDTHPIRTLAGCCSNASLRDTRLGLSYATLGPIFFHSVPPSDLIVMFSDALGSAFHLSPDPGAPVAHRLQFVFVCHALMSSRLSNYKHLCSSDGCFPLGTDLLPTPDIFRSLAPKLQTLMSTLCRDALMTFVSKEMQSVSESIDFDRFYHDLDYQKSTIYGLCATHLSLGLRLCRLRNLPQDEALFSRLEYILVDDVPDAKHELDHLIQQISKLDQGFERLTSRLSTSCYPFFINLASIKLFFYALPPETGSCLMGQLPVSFHKSILDILAKDSASCTKLIQSVTYKTFIDLLFQSDLSSSDSSFHAHPFYGLIETKRAASTISKVIQLISNSDLDSKPSLSTGDAYALYGLNALYSSERLESFRSSLGIMTLLSHIGPQVDPNSPKRLLKWVDELVFSGSNCQLTVSHRRWILNKTQTYLSRPADSKQDFESTKTPSVPASCEHEWRDALKQIQSYLTHLDRVERLTKDLDFPSVLGLTSNQNNLLHNFRESILATKPKDETQAIRVLQDLTNTIIEQQNLTDSRDEQSGEQVIRVLNLLAKILPACIEALNLDSMVAMQVLANSIALTLTLLPNAIQMTIQSIINKEAQTENKHPADPSSTNDLILPVLLDLIRSYISTQQSSPNQILPDVFAGLLLSRRSIRQRFGYDLLLNLANSFSSAQGPVEKFKHSVLGHSLNDLRKFPNQSAFNTMMDEVCQELRKDSSDQLMDGEQLIGLADQLIQKVVISSDSLSEEMLDLERDVIELIEVIVPNKPPGNACSFETVPLWTQWLTHCLDSNLPLFDDPIQTDRFFVSNSYCFSFPNPSLIRASLSLLTNSPRSPPSLCVQTSLFTSCLIHPNCDLIRDTLNVFDTLITQSPSFVDLIRSHDALHFVWVHTDQWIQLARSDEHRLKLFGQLLDSLVHLLPTLPTTNNPQKLGCYCIRALKEANLWAEAIYLSKAIQPRTRNPMPLDYVVSFIHDLVTR